MSNYTCKKGWLVAPDENGNNVPFFVKVRDKDIIWSMNNSIEDGVLDAVKKGSIVEKFLEPRIQVLLSNNGWEVTSFGDDRYEATMRIKVGETEFKFGSNLSYDIYTPILLPFATENDDRLNITCMVHSKSLDLNTATFNAEFSETAQSISSFNLHLMNPIYNFDPEMNQNSEYNTSDIFVRVSGRLTLC